MTREVVVVTGSLGGIGRAISARLQASGIAVIGIDRATGDAAQDYQHVCCDLASVVDSAAAREALTAAIDAAAGRLGSDSIVGLVNNAAEQVVAPAASVDPLAVRRSMDVNVIAPLVLSQCLYRRLASGKGCIINISSVHARLTKAGFCAYSTSKAALSGLSRALAVEWGGDVRVATLEPAAVATPMLEAGFAGQPGARAALDAAHPSHAIGTAEQVAEWVYRLVVDRHPFSNGMLIRLDGGIGSRLFDPG